MNTKTYPYPYRAGQIFTLADSHDYYILAVIDSNTGNREMWTKFSLINLRTGNRWGDPIRIVYGTEYCSHRRCTEITEKEFQALAGEDLFQLYGDARQLAILQS